MDFPTLAAYPGGLSYEETSLLLSEMQRQSSDIEASRDEAETTCQRDEQEEEGYEINMTDYDFGTLEISPTDPWDHRSAAVSGDNWKKTTDSKMDNRKKKQSKSRSSRLYGAMEAPLSPHVDTTGLSIMDPPVGKDPDQEDTIADEGSSIMDTLSDLADGVDHEMDTVKGLLYKIKRERDTYKRTNHALQQSLSEAIAFKSDLEAEHRQALDVILCTANDEKRRLENELRQSNESKRKLKKMVTEMIEEKSSLEKQLNEKDDKLKKASVPNDVESKLEEERERHLTALNQAITDLEAKFENDMKEVIQEKDEQFAAAEKKHKESVSKLETILNDAMEEKEAEMKTQRHSHSMIVQALEEQKLMVQEELKSTTESLNKLKEEHAMSEDVHDMEISDLRKEFEQIKARVQKQFRQKECQLQEEIDHHSKAIDDLETKLQTESMQCQALVSELATRKEELASKNADIITLEKKLSDRSTTYTQEYDRMKAHLTKMCNLVESSSADRDLAREETKNLKAEHEKQNKAHKAEIERLKRKLEDGAREMAHLASSASGENDETRVSSTMNKDAAVNISCSSSESRDQSDEVMLLSRLEAALKERDEFASQVQALTNAKTIELPSCASEEESITHLGDIDSREAVGGVDVAAIERERDNLAAKVQELESSLEGKEREIASFIDNKDSSKGDQSGSVDIIALQEERDSLVCKVQELALSLQEKDGQETDPSPGDNCASLTLKVQEMEATIADKNHEIAQLNMKLSSQQHLDSSLSQKTEEVSALEITHQELIALLNEKNKELAELEHSLELASQERKVAGTEEQDLVEYSMANIETKMIVDSDTEAITQERDQLQSEIERLQILLEEAELFHVENDVEPSEGINDDAVAAMNEMVEELTRLEETLSQREEELSDYKIKVCMHERLEKECDVLKEELATLKATLKERSLGNSTSSLNNEIVDTCLARYEKENESLRATLEEKSRELSNLEETLAKLEEEMVDLKGKASAFESLERERDKMKAELITLKAAVEYPDDESAAAKLGEDLANLKLEHRVEIKLIKKDHAATKTKCKLLKKELQKISNEQREMMSAYEAERKSNAELSSSLEEMVTLLEKERAAHSDQTESLRGKLDGLKLKFTRLKKNVDFGNEYEVAIAKANQEIASKVETIESLTEQLSETKANLESVESKIETHLSQDKEASLARVRALEDEIELLTSQLAEKTAEVEVLTQQLIDTKDGLDDLESQLEIHVQKDAETIQGLEEKVEEEKQLHEETIQKMNGLNNHIHQLKSELKLSEINMQSMEASHSNEIRQSTSAYDKIKEELTQSQTEVNELNVKLEYCESKLALAQREQSQLVLETTERQEELKKCRDEIELLNSSIADYEEQVANLQGECTQLKQSAKIADCSQREYEGEAKRYCAEIELLRKQMAAAEVKSKQVLKQEVDRLKAEFNEVIAAFEKELVDTCESNASETDKLQKQLAESKENISLLEIQIADLKSQNQDTADKLADKMDLETALMKAQEQLADAEAVNDALSELQKQHNALMESFDEIKHANLDLNKTLEETEASKNELKSKLHDTLLSVDSNAKAYNDLQADHDSLLKECEVLRGDSSSLHALVSSLTSEKEKLMNDIDQQAEEYRKMCDFKSSLEHQIQKHEEHQSSLEALISTLRGEIVLKEENIKSLKKDLSSKQQQIDSLRQQSKTANGHLDEMVTYCDKLKSDYTSTSASLRKELDEQAHSMKDVINALKNQLLSSETEKEENRKMYESDIELQQSEVETLKKKNREARDDLDSLSNLVSGLKEALEEEKSNAQVLRSQFKESESDRKAVEARNRELQEELTSKYASEAIMQERIHDIEMEVSDLRPMPEKLTEMMKTEGIMRERIRVLESQLCGLGEVETKLINAQNIEVTMRDRIRALESQSKSLQAEYKDAVKSKEGECSKLRVVLQECREKLQRLMEENQSLRHDNNESVANLKTMLNEAIRSRADTEAALQESLHLLEQQKRVDVKRKGELCKLEQTVDILKSKERYLESYVSSLKNQLSRDSR